ncbi:MAG: hypothetical protein O2840_02435 [bacterium]|nr:hypothetical protein [bacterium]
MHDLDLTPYNLQRPEKLEWLFPKVQSEEEMLQAIISKSLRAFLRKSDILIEQVGVTWEHKVVSLQEYLDWLSYYTEKMEAQNYSVFATKNWYNEKISDGFKIEGIFLYKRSILIGSTIISVNKDQSVATAHFRASDSIDLFHEDNASIGALIDFLFLRTMYRNGYKKLSSGRARNAAGVLNKLGYIDYKLRFGFSPTLIVGIPNASSVPLSENGTVLFFGLQENKLVMVGCRKNGSEAHFESQRFATDKIKFVLLEH